MVIAGRIMTFATDFQPLTGADRAKMAIFDHPQEKEGSKHVDLVFREKRKGKSTWK